MCQIILFFVSEECDTRETWHIKANYNLQLICLINYFITS